VFLLQDQPQQAKISSVFETCAWMFEIQTQTQMSKAKVFDKLTVLCYN